MSFFLWICTTFAFFHSDGKMPCVRQDLKIILRGLQVLSLIKNWKKVSDKKGFGGTVLMDLSKDFDTIKHDLLVAQLYAYGFNKESLKLLHNYLSNRWHRTKINNLVYSKSWFKEYWNDLFLVLFFLIFI